MSDKNSAKQTAVKNGKENEKDEEASEDISSGSGSRDVVEASDENVQEAPYGNRSYAAPDFDDNKD